MLAFLRVAAAVLLVTFPIGCRSTPAPVETPAIARELPTTWRASTPQGFRALLSEEPWSAPLQWSEFARTTLLQSLTANLDTPQAAEEALRAALLLTLDRRPGAERTLFTRLERRLKAQARGRAACDIVCARALGKREDLEPALRGDLRILAIGPYPHPELEVRVECARAYLESMDKTLRPVPLSARPVLLFLVRVLRAETPAQRGDPPDWERVETLAWAKTRAAEALAAWRVDPPRYTPDGAWSAQNEWADATLHELGLEP